VNVRAIAGLDRNAVRPLRARVVHERVDDLLHAPAAPHLTRLAVEEIRDAARRGIVLVDKRPSGSQLGLAGRRQPACPDPHVRCTPALGRHIVP